MNISFRWLRAMAPGLDPEPEKVAERLAMRGAPVDAMDPVGHGLGDVVVGRVDEVRSHPDADRLVLCDVTTGEGEPVQVVCGAPVVRSGSYYPFIPEGGVLPGGMKIRKAKIRGQVSRGMLCSERELGLGRDEAGILELHGDLTPGMPLREALELEDWRLDVEVTPNRPDLLSHIGVAREVAPEGAEGIVLPPIPAAEAGPGAPAAGLDFRRGNLEVEAGGVAIRIEAPDLCRRYLGAVIRGVKLGPSPEWLAGRLRAVGARPINNVVDATNYVLHELGQPLHAFDLARLGEDRIVVRTARPGEGIRTLDGQERRLEEGMLAICDARVPVAVAGVMGGEEPEVSEGTTDLLLECALFQPAQVRSTRRALGLSTDSSYRFERGVDPEGMERALARAIRVILATAGGRLDGPILDAHPRPVEGRSLPLRISRVEQVLGLAMESGELAALLEPLGFVIREKRDDGLGVEVPGHRIWDVTREIDLIEEVARVYGYDRFPEELGPFRPGRTEDHPLFLLEDRVRDRLTALGFLEASTPGFAPEAEGEVELANPISVEESHLRRDLLPGLLRRVERNFARGARDVRLFEIGTVFRRGGSGELPREATRVAVALTGRIDPPHWSREDRPVDVWEVRGLLEQLVPLVGDGSPGRIDVGIRRHSLVKEDLGYTVTGADGGALGVGGRVREGAMDVPPWADAVWALEIELPPEPTVRREETVRPLPAFPVVERDLAVVVPDALPAASILTLVEARGGALLEAVRVFDVFRGEAVPRGHRSIALRLTFRSEERTLTDAEVDERMEAIVSALTEELDVQIRGR